MFVTQNLPAASILFWLNVEGYEVFEINLFLFVCFPKNKEDIKMYKIYMYF